MSLADEFPEITTTDEPLAPRTWLKVGGPAQYFVEPRNEDELQAVVRYCNEHDTPARLLGGGSNLLVSSKGVDGAVIHLEHEAFRSCDVDGTKVRAGGGLPLSSLINAAVKHDLAGLEVLVGIPGTVGGALHGNAGGRAGDVGQFVESVDVLTAAGERFTRSEDELSFGYRSSSLNELCVLSATFALKSEPAEQITRRMKKGWIVKKASQPFSHQSAGCIFRNPRGMSAGSLIEQAGMKGTRIGGAEISEQHANFIVTHENATSDDVERLIDLAASKVHEQFGVELAAEIRIWK